MSSASKWEWTLAYPRYGFSVRSGTVGRQPFVVPAGEAIRFNLYSADVIHSFWIPDLRFKHDAIPGSRPGDHADVRQAGDLQRTVRRVLRAAALGHGVHVPRRQPELLRRLGAEQGNGGAMSTTSLRPPRIARTSGWVGALTSTDHKRIGLNLGICSIVFFLLGGVFALLMRTQLAQSNMQFVSDNSYNELFTMHGSTMIYLFVTPMAIAMATYLVPLQIGALRMACRGWHWPGSGPGSRAG